jgi:hypothetical protein
LALLGAEDKISTCQKPSFQGRWMAKLEPSDPVLQKLYYKNAMKIIQALR